MNRRPKLASRGRSIGRPAVLAATLLSLLLPAAASAHPLGNFTINVYDGLTVAAEWTHLERIVDMAELPTVTARQQMDADADQAISNTEAATWAQQACVTATRDITLSVGGAPRTLTPTGVGIAFAEGQAGLPTLRLACTYDATPGVGADPTTVDFSDIGYAERQGWREIVVSGANATISGGESFSDTSQRLRAYPETSNGGVRDQRSATFSVVATGAATPATRPQSTETAPLGSPPEQVVIRGTSQPASVPGGADIPAELRSLLAGKDLSLPALALAIIVAAVVGAAHAASPGHGKTLMAAYLVGSRGTARHALVLGLTVTVSHTIGVLVLGAIVWLAGAMLPAERVFPILGLVSGLVVTGLGAAFLWQRIRSRANSHAREHDHAHSHQDEEDGWHSHGGIRHTHLPAGADPLRRRNLIALGLVGGLVPSASAILILVGSIAAGRPELGMLLTLAFGAGMAAVLVGVGVLLVRARSLVERLPSPSVGRLLGFAPLASALTFVLVGVAVAFQSWSQL